MTATSPTQRLLAWLGVAALLGLAWLLRGLLVSLLLAFLLAWALDPVVNRLVKLGVPRALAAMLVLLGLAAGITVVLVVAVPYLTEQLGQVAELFPSQFAAAQLRLEGYVWDRFHVRLPHTWGELSTELVAGAGKYGAELARGAVSALFGTLDAIILAAGFLLVPLFALWLLLEYDRVLSHAERLVPRRWAGLVGSVAREIDRTLGGWLRGQGVACVVLGALYAVGLSLVGIRLAVPIGLFTGLLAFVPYVGFGGGLLFAVAMAILDWHGVDRVVAVVAAMLFVQVLDATIITPRIVGHSVGLHPLEVLVAITAAATLFGFLGVLLAVPFGAIVKILLRRGARAYLRSAFYRTPAEGPYVTPLPVSVQDIVVKRPPGA